LHPQLASYTVTVGGTPVSVVNNAANSTNCGIEGQLHYNFTTDFSVNAGAA
jgi:hypothetical protein